MEIGARSPSHKGGFAAKGCPKRCASTKLCLCFAEIEFHNHLFFTCDNAKEIWKTIFTWLNWYSSDRASYKADIFLSFVHPLRGKKANRVSHLISLATCWSIWLERNNVLFNGKVAIVKEVIDNKC